MSKKALGKVVKLFISENNNTKRKRCQQIHVDQNGIINSKFYNKKIDRSVLLSSLHAYALCKDQNINISYGDLGENLLLDFNPHTLPMHSLLSIGSVILQLTLPCTLCKGLSTIDAALPILLEHDRGVFFKVIQAGSIKQEETVYLLPTELISHPC